MKKKIKKKEIAVADTGMICAYSLILRCCIRIPRTPAVSAAVQIPARMQLCTVRSAFRLPFIAFAFVHQVSSEQHLIAAEGMAVVFSFQQPTATLQ